MGPIRSGELALVTSRTITVVDPNDPNTANPATPLRPLVKPRSRDVLLVAKSTGHAAGDSITLTLYGSMDGTTNSWFSLGQAFSGAPIVAGTNEAQFVASSTNYSEYMTAVLTTPYLWIDATGTLNSTSWTISLYSDE